MALVSAFLGTGVAAELAVALGGLVGGVDVPVPGVPSAAVDDEYEGAGTLVVWDLFYYHYLLQVLVL